MPPGTPETGLFNEATLTQPGQPGRTAVACGDLPYITLNKQFVSATAATTDTWDVVYRIVVTNTGPVDGVYTLSDKPDFDNDVALKSASFAATTSCGQTS